MFCMLFITTLNASKREKDNGCFCSYSGIDLTIREATMCDLDELSNHSCSYTFTPKLLYYCVADLNCIFLKSLKRANGDELIIWLLERHYTMFIGIVESSTHIGYQGFGVLLIKVRYDIFLRLYTQINVFVICSH